MTDPATLRPVWRGLTVALLTLAVLLGLAPAAAAHVAVDSAGPNGDGTATVTLSWNHSCTPEAATTGVDVAAGPGVSFTGASTDIAGWTSTVNPSSVTFTGPGVPTGEKVSVAVTARIEGTAGEAITFPAVQHCRDQAGGDQQSAWTDPDPASEHPAPSLVATTALLAPAPLAEPTSGADITQVLTGIVLLAAVLGVLGFVAERRAQRRPG